ncbi:MAG: NUDIX hydrolase [Rubrobacteraceae bacterium]|nr:NUDIX domain-containing protein [Rubrobacter sp.]
MTGIVRGPDDRVLLVRGRHRGWEPPGGQVEHGEDLVTALKREVSEESNCEIEVGGLASVCSNLGRRVEDVPEQVHFMFKCSWLRGEPRAGEECVDAGWFSVRESLRLVTAPQQKDKLLDALAEESGAPYRAFRTRPYELVLELNSG